MIDPNTFDFGRICNFKLDWALVLCMAGLVGVLVWWAVFR